MKRVLMVVVAGLLLVLSGCSYPYGRDSGMMAGDGPGYRDGGGMHSWMGEGYGMGPWMMQGDGSGYRHGVDGMNRGMMGGGQGMEPGMMWRDGPGDDALNLTAEQRAKLSDIRSDFHRKQWALMEKMHEQGWRSGGSGGLGRDGQLDEQAARKAYDTMADMRKQMFENSLQARKQIDSVLTPQQREQMRGSKGSQ